MCSCQDFTEANTSSHPGSQQATIPPIRTADIHHPFFLPASRFAEGSPEPWEIREAGFFGGKAPVGSAESFSSESSGYSTLLAAALSVRRVRSGMSRFAVAGETALSLETEFPCFVSC